MSYTLDLSALAAGLSTPIWITLSGAVSGLSAWIISIRKIDASIEQARIKAVADASAGEAAERTAFRETLMTELSAMRQQVKECESEKDTIRERVNNTERQILVLKASNEIMEKWVVFFKDRNEPNGQLPTKAA